MYSSIFIIQLSQKLIKCISISINKIILNKSKAISTLLREKSSFSFKQFNLMWHSPPFCVTLSKQYFHPSLCHTFFSNNVNTFCKILINTCQLLIKPESLENIWEERETLSFALCHIMMLIIITTAPFLTNDCFLLNNYGVFLLNKYSHYLPKHKTLTLPIYLWFTAYINFNLKLSSNNDFFINDIVLCLGTAHAERQDKTCCVSLSTYKLRNISQ